MTNDQEVAMAQAHCQMWENCTSRPFTTREVAFAKLVRNQALEEAAQNLIRNADKCSLVLEQSVLQCNAHEIRNLKEPTP